MAYFTLSKSYSPQLVSATLLVAGTCIGGGMLALPVATSYMGFFPSVFMMFIVCVAMTLTALYLVEIGFWMKKDDAHVISMSSSLLGKPGKSAAWLLYLFISYASLISYTAGGGHLLAKAFSTELFSKNMGCWLFMLLFGPAIFCSHKILGRINSYFFIGMIAAYFVLVVFSVPEVKGEFLARQDWKYSWIAFPLLLTAFSFQTMVPSLHPFLNHHAPSLRIAIIGGTSIALIIYVIWQAVVLGCVPLHGENGLAEALYRGEAATSFIGIHINNPWIEFIACFFAFFALVTSFFGISLGLYDFLSDGLDIKKEGWGRITLTFLVIAPTLFFAVTYERIFLLALDMSGGIGDALLNGIMPLLMIYVGRYILKKKEWEFRVFGRRSLIIVLFFFYLAVLVFDLFVHIGRYDPISEIRKEEIHRIEEISQ